VSFSGVHIKTFYITLQLAEGTDIINSPCSSDTLQRIRLWRFNHFSAMVHPYSLFSVSFAALRFT